MIQITLPSNEVKTFENTPVISLREIAQSISNSFAKEVLIAHVNTELKSLDYNVTAHAHVTFYKWEDSQGKEVFWNTTAILYVFALKLLYPSTKMGCVKTTENGFYVDVDLEDMVINETHFKNIEEKMRSLIQSKSAKISTLNKIDAISLFCQKKEHYILEELRNSKENAITILTLEGEVLPLFSPILSDFTKIKASKLSNIAGAYWKGDEKNKMISRIYGNSFPQKALLDEFIAQQQEAKNRDHRKLGKELDLFYFDEEVGMGLPLWAPKGEQLRQNLIDFLKRIQRKHGYQHVATPHIGKKELYITSGHYEKYGEDAYQPIKTPAEGEDFFLKPMNCPHHCKIYSAKPRSYKSLPIKYAEFGTVYRYEQSGELHGLTRVRGFTQDDAHIFCRPDQLKQEFLAVVDLVNQVYSKLGFTKFETQISVRDTNNKNKYLGTDEMWHLAEKAIIEATSERGMQTTIKEGEAAFYGPKLDFIVKDAIGRKWQIGTIQVDYMMPENFDLTFISSDNSLQRPVMIHRALFGSIERFIALLIENTNGNFPLWLNPTKLIVLPVSSVFQDHAFLIAQKINSYFDWNVEVDERDEKINRKIRDAETQKIPYMLIIGENELTNDTISLRKHGVGGLGEMKLDEFIENLNVELASMYE